MGKELIRKSQAKVITEKSEGAAEPSLVRRLQLDRGINCG